MKESRKSNDEKAAARALVRSDFYAYRRYMDPRIIDGWWQRDIAKNLQQFADDLKAGLAPMLVIQAPPQHGKSVQIIDFISWLAGLDPSLRTIYASFSERLGVRANLKLQRIYDSERYKSVFPDTTINSSNVVTISGQYLRNREILEYVGHDGYFRNTTVRGSITGESLDLGVIDDPIKGREEANSETIRNKTWDWFLDDFFTRFSERAGLLAILTRWHIDDPIGRLIASNPKVKVLSYPAIATRDEEHRKEGEPLFPEHKSLEFLERRRAMMSSWNWEALYQQNPIPSDGMMFKREWFDGKFINTAPAGTVWVRHWDLAATKRQDAARTAGVKIGRAPDGTFVVGHVAKFQEEGRQVRQLIKQTAEMDGRDVEISLPQDPGQAGKTQAQDMVLMLAGYKVKAEPETGDKATRAEPFASQCEMGNVYIVRGPWNADYLDELCIFPSGPFKDQVDASSGAFARLLKPKAPVAASGATRRN